MDAVQQISLYSTLFYVSMALCILGFVLAIVFYFVFDIRKVYTQITGRGKEKLMERSKKEKSRELQRRDAAPLRSSELYTGGITGGVTPPDASAAASGGQTEPTEETAQTTVLSEDEAATTLLPQSLAEDEGATTMLPQNGSAASESGVTTYLAPQTQLGRFELFEYIVEIHTDELI